MTSLAEVRETEAAEKTAMVKPQSNEKADHGIFTFGCISRGAETVISLIWLCFRKEYVPQTNFGALKLFISAFDIQKSYLYQQKGEMGYMLC